MAGKNNNNDSNQETPKDDKNTVLEMKAPDDRAVRKFTLDLFVHQESGGGDSGEQREWKLTTHSADKGVTVQAPADAQSLV